MVIKAQSPAGFAEEYIIESIWNNRFPQVLSIPDCSRLFNLSNTLCLSLLAGRLLTG